MCSLLMYVCRLHIALVWIHVGTSLSQYDVVGRMGMLEGFV